MSRHHGRHQIRFRLIQSASACFLPSAERRRSAHDHGAHAISLTSWTIWIGANATTALYAWVRLTDVALASVSAFNTACCVLVFCIAGYKRLVFTRSPTIQRLEAA
ncbi:MAG: hypothetical protein Q8M18_08970 [Bradyrhizobium sp.]|nr:hypothetical protein [Bradyrhizobium sp.]